MKAKKTATLLILTLVLFLWPVSSTAASTAAAPVSETETVSTYEDYAEYLAKLGVFLGTGSGFELDRAPTRIEGLVMLIRLLGAEDDAIAMQGKSLSFTDVPKWAVGYVAYAYESGLTNGIGATRFGASDPMEAKAYMTFLLRSLGYNDQAGDFSYNNAVDFANSIDLISDSTYSALNTTKFIRAHVAKTSFDALRFPYRGGNVLLIDKLAAENKINPGIAAEIKKTTLGEPSQTTSQNAAVVNVQKNMDRVVMISCYGEDPDMEPYIGSGVVLSSDGKIVTNYHVLEDTWKMEITFNDGSIYKGNVYVLDYDKDLDLAILKIDKTGLTPAVIGDSGKVRVGDPVVSIGSPYGYFNTVTDGIVSAIRADSIQTSAAINPGNSGGGLFDRDGKLIGIPSSNIYLADNMGFAIPIDRISKVSGSQNILLADFYKKNTGLLPPAPTGLALLFETETTAMLKWNPVAGADSYYIYYKTKDDEEYYYFDETEPLEGEYDFMATALEPGEEYSIKVSAEVGERESVKSTAVTFVKSSAPRQYGSFNPYYPGFSGVPDFGKLAGIKPYQQTTNRFDYDITEVSLSDMIIFSYLMDELGYTRTLTFTDPNGLTLSTYQSETMNRRMLIRSENTEDGRTLFSIEIGDDVK